MHKDPRPSQTKFPFQKYFRSGQAAFVRMMLNESSLEAEKKLSVVIDRCDGNILELSLVYGENALDGYCLEVGRKLKISSEAFGVGVVNSGVVLSQPRPSMLRIRLDDNLELCYQREHERVDLLTRLAFVHKQETLDLIVDEWQELELSPELVSERYPLEQGKINIGVGGFRVNVASSLQLNDIVLLVAELDSISPPIIALSEVAWIDLDEMVCGLRFVILRQEDQKRIERLVWHETKGSIAG